MAYRPTCLEDSLDAWASVEADSERVRAVIHWLMDLCAADGRRPGAPLPNTYLPIFVAPVENQDVFICWVIVDRYHEVAVRRLYDRRRNHWFGQ